VFKGRARRAEYWWFALFSFIFSLVFSLIDAMIGSDIGILEVIWSLGILIPSLAVAARRMHDCDKSGWFMLVPIYNLILSLTKGSYGENRFGPDPKAEENR
jgi:uncharacterized membrane protein YhaH (DUF805 family)